MHTVGLALTRVFYSQRPFLSDLTSLFVIPSSAFLIRPFSGFIFGGFGDCSGRRQPFFWPVILMIILMFAMWCLSTYSQIKTYTPWFINIRDRTLNIDSKKEVITFVANSETIGDRFDPSTMDYFQGVQYPHLSLILPYFKRHFYHKIEVVDWQDKTVNWTDKKKIILGPVWGYTRAIDEFLEWLDLIDNTDAQVINNSKFMKWNIKKNYLLDLKERNIPIPSTFIVEPTSLLSFDDAKSIFYEKFGESDIILKGVVDAGGFGYMHVCLCPLREVRSHFDYLKENNHGVIIQTFVPEIYKKGKLSFVIFNREISHFFVKVPKYNEEKVQPFYGGRSFHFASLNDISAIEEIKSSFRTDLELCEKEVWDAYSQIQLIYENLLVVLKELEIPPPTYLRIDGMMVNSCFTVMELEGIEPYLEIQEAMNINPSNDILARYVKSLY